MSGSNSNGAEVLLPDLVKQVQHRIDAHRAALALTDQLQPTLLAVLEDSIRDTKVRIEEAEAIMSIIRRLFSPR